MGASFIILPQNPVCLGPLTAQLAACMAMIARTRYNSVQKHSLCQKGFGIHTRSCFFRDAPGYWVLRFTLLVTKPTLSHIRPRGKARADLGDTMRVLGGVADLGGRILKWAKTDIGGISAKTSIFGVLGLESGFHIFGSKDPP